jgi:uroporphyrinogen-III synthase
LTVRLLVTRPEPDAERTAAALRARGHFVIVTPLLRIEALPDAEVGSGPRAAILVTSANAARAIARHERVAELKHVPVLAVGDRSAQAMRDVGFTEVISAGGAGGDLTRLAAERLSQSVPLLYLCGEDRSGDIAGDLSAQNFTVRTVVIYRAVAADTLPRPAAEALAGGIGGVLHFSRRTAEAFVNLVRGAGMGDAVLLKGPAQFCLSAHVAEPLSQAGAADLRIAPQPTEEALIDLIPSG